jgi:hypothetical protein
MDFPMDVVASQLTQEWEALMQALWEGLAWTVMLAVLAVAVGGVVMASCRTLRPRRFWCRSTVRDVEVLFDEWGPPGFRQALHVVKCSAFEPASAIACRRACLDGTCRWPAAPFGLSALHAGPG